MDIWCYSSVRSNLRPRFPTPSLDLKRLVLARGGSPPIAQSGNRGRSKTAVSCTRGEKRMDREKEAIVDGELFAKVMPKEEIGALEFLKEHPESDGRGVLIAIFDTGVDPGTKGLQITTDGRPKIVDVLDCTGAGDVDTSEVVKMDEDGFIKGVNGNLLRVNPSWKNPTGDWHVGVKPLFELFPMSLKTQVKEKRLKKFKEAHREAVTKASKELADFQTSHPRCADPKDQKWKQELESRVKLLDGMISKYEDMGPLLDCVVWHDGKTWRAALDMTDLYEEGEEEKGKLENFTPLTNFHLEHQYGTFSSSDACNFVCNIYEEGKILSIVVDCSSHGTHVAGIASAHHPEDPRFNGVAPGARIISCKIGDLRVGTMETVSALARAIIVALQYKVDIINFSYGEAIAFPNRGRLIELISELVYKHRIIYVCAAGNNGPGLSSVGGPSSSEAVISVGAFVSPAMAEVAHSRREKLEEGVQYTFSSRGPTVDGTMGVCISAPGGAISNYPQWTGQSRNLANGTSMASPSACGGITLLLSALKQQEREYSPVEVRRALENTCFFPSASHTSEPSHLTYGHGLLQVNKAWEYLEASKNGQHSKVRFNIQVQRSDASGDNSAKSGECSSLLPSSGIYLREPLDVGKKHTFAVTVTPLLHEDSDVAEDQLAVEMNLKLVSSADWVRCPQPFLLAHNKRMLEVEIDATGLPEGVNFAQIKAYEVNESSQGFCFSIPVTVITPIQPKASPYSYDLGSFDFQAGKELRKFVSIPYGATWAEIIFTAGEFEGSRVYFSDRIYFLPDVRPDETSSAPSFRLTAGQTHTTLMPVVGGRMFEVCLAQYWSSLGESSVSIAIEFHGVTINQGKDLMVNGGNGNLKIQVAAPFRREKINPSFTLKSLLISLAPSEALISPFSSSRDTLPDARVIHKLELTYNLKLTEGGKITPRFPMLNRQVYDSEVEAQMVQLFNQYKKRLWVTDIYPSAVSLKKGDYTFKALIRHDNPQILKNLEKMPLVVEKQLEKTIALPVYKTMLDSVRASNNFKSMELYPGQVVTMVIGPLTADLPKDCTPGSIMRGEITMGQGKAKAEAVKSGETFSFLVPPTPPSAAANNDLPEELSLSTKLDQAARDAKIKALEGWDLTTAESLKSFDEAVKKLKDEYPKHLPFLTKVLQKYDNLGDLKSDEKKKNIIELCQEIISCIDEVQLACFLARKTPDDSQEGKKRSKEATEEKDALILALEKQITNTMSLKGTKELIYDQTDKESPDPDVCLKEIEPLFEELKKWIEPSDASIRSMTCLVESAHQRHVEAVKLFDEMLSSEKTTNHKEVSELRVKCLKALGWKHWVRHEERKLKINFPKNYTPF